MRALVCALLCAGCMGERAAQSDYDVVHGEDDRRDYYQVEDERLRELTSRSVVALMSDARLDRTDPTNIRFLGDDLQKKENLCDSERFLDNPTAAYCSGTLIADDLVLTASHCVKGEDPCADINFVFGYYYEAPGELHRVTQDDVFRCTEVITSFDGVTADGRNLDHAVVRLDRPAAPRFAPVPIGRRALGAKEPLAVISFASGIPAKIDAGSVVVDPREEHRDFFTSDSDVFVYSSGAGVFDRAGTELLGIVVRGPRDYVRTVDGCQTVNVCESACGGSYPYEENGYAKHALADLCYALPESPLCAPG